MSDKLKFFLGGMAFMVIARALWLKFSIWRFRRELAKVTACPKCRGKKEIDMLVPHTTSMETEKITCPSCKGSGEKSFEDVVLS